MLVALLGGFFDGLVAELMVFLLVLILLTLDTEMRRPTGNRPPMYRLINPNRFTGGDPMQTQARPDPTRNIQPGAVAPAGIYVVSHRYPSHALPHEVTISASIVLPGCSYCTGVHFSRKCSSPMPIEDCEFFQSRVGNWRPNCPLISRRPVVLFRPLARVRLKFGHWFGSSLTLLSGLRRY
jgi:hypothetical protein